MFKFAPDRILAELSSCRKGSVSLIFGFSLLPLIAVSGAAVDYARAKGLKSQLQAAVDATAIAVASADQSAAQKLGQNTLVGLNATIDSVSVSVDEGRSFVVAQHNLQTVFMHIFGFETIPIRVAAAAEMVTSSQKVCMLALNETEPQALSFSGSAGFLGPECAVHSNSADSEGLYVGNNATAVAAEFCSRGGYAVPADFDQRIRGSCWPIRDPFEGKIQAPDASGCDYNNLNVNPNQHRILESGIYCGGLSIRGSVEFAPGAQIVIKDGGFQINSQAHVRGDDVFFYLTGQGAGFTFNAGADIDVRAATGGAFGGVLLYQDPTSSPGAENRLNGSANSRFNGAFYTPGNGLRLNGSSGFGQDSDYMPIIADTITVTGNTDMKIDLTGVNMVAPIPEMFRGVRLTQ